jgi:hypothetical protein
MAHERKYHWHPNNANAKIMLETATWQLREKYSEIYEQISKKAREGELYLTLESCSKDLRFVLEFDGYSVVQVLESEICVDWGTVKNG